MNFSLATEILEMRINYLRLSKRTLIDSIFVLYEEERVDSILITEKLEWI